jgi:hypothetical protein
MTEEEQWQEINYPTFFGAVAARIKNAKIALDAAQIKPVGRDWLETSINNVKILWREEGADCLVNIGVRSNTEPFYQLRFPTKWLEM